MDGHFSDVQHILKYGQKLDLYDVNYEQQFKPTTLLTDIWDCIPFKVVKHINPIRAIKSFTRSNCKFMYGVMVNYP